MLQNIGFVVETKTSDAATAFDVDTIPLNDDSVFAAQRVPHESEIRMSKIKERTQVPLQPFRRKNRRVDAHWQQAAGLSNDRMVNFNDMTTLPDV